VNHMPLRLFLPCSSQGDQPDGLAQGIHSLIEKGMLPAEKANKMEINTIDETSGRLTRSTDESQLPSGRLTHGGENDCLQFIHHL
jgi:hypothetical protein